MSSKNLKEIADKARKNDFISISELMTGIETRVFSRKEVSQIIFKESHKSLKIGITGPPGAGKSSLMNKLIPLIRKENLSVGVIAIDPSSPITGGSFLGDRVRINNAVNDDNVFVRSMGSRAELGGVTELAEDFSDILAFSGKDIIFIETVGVGQSEIVASNLVDIFTLIVGPGSGDELQGIKKGITEYADIFIVNKNDGELKMEASKTAADYKSALSYYKKLDELEKQVLLVSSIEQTGMEDVIKTINQIIDQNKLKGIFDERRADQLEYWIEEEVKNIIASDITNRLTSKGNIPKYSEKVMRNEMSMYEAVETITKDTLKQ